MKLVTALIAAALVLQWAPVSAQTPGRGELLYANHCGACHGVQMHWRNKKLATDWNTLLAQVRRWQDAARLDWSDADIEAVARYLNAGIYRYPEPVRVGMR
jgi:mono/diheme cytochrome c family protein